MLLHMENFSVKNVKNYTACKRWDSQVGININIGVNEFDKIKKLCVKEEINMIIVAS